MRRSVALLLTLLAVLLVGCGGSNSANNRPPSAAPASPAGTARAGAAVSPATAATPQAAKPKGELRIAASINFPTSLDIARDNGSQFIRWGAAETLTRLTREQKVQPWLADSVTSIDPQTWRVVLRKGVTFWDGSPMTADDVVAAFHRNWDTLPLAKGLLSPGTAITVIGPLTLEFKTPQPAVYLPNTLASYQFVIYKPGPNGASIMTGPYRPTQFSADHELVEEPYLDYWGGAPPFARIDLKLVTDANARVLALQSGDEDVLVGIPPDVAQGLGGGITVASVPSTRVHMLLLNNSRLPFSDLAVRQATSLAIDRDALNKTALGGLGEVATTLFPSTAGVPLVPGQHTDVNQAKQLLDGAGWKLGADGVRAKDGQRLAFTLYSYPGRAELTPMAVAIQAQLKPLGYDIQVQSVQDIAGQTKDANFDAAMYSLNTVLTGDPPYLFKTSLITGSAGNSGRYSNPMLDALVKQLSLEPDPAKQADLTKQAETIVNTDVPNVYLVAPPIVYAYRQGKLANFQPNPNDLYFLDAMLRGS